ncbi:MAG: acetate/propionate family kinase [Pirellulales bacterium]|nr:acetate/propionate family kinase [Pirellulales bacterium]
MKILLLNAGSSSLKATLAESTDGRTIAHCIADWAGPVTRYRYVGPGGKSDSAELAASGHAEALTRFLVDLTSREPIALPTRAALWAVGHRVVHGGPFTASVRITPEVRERIRALNDVAPLHNPPSLDTLTAAEGQLPDVPHIAVFDTAFHATMPPEAYTYPVPQRWTREWGIRRYGFHGLSHAYCSRRAAEMLRRPLAELRLVICHLGHGCSASAVHHGRCIDTTMGFTPLEGLMMATRCGSIDPSIALYVQKHQRLNTAEVEFALNRASGLLGVSGVSGDMRQVLAAARQGNEGARLALAIYSRRVRQAIGALTVTMGGIDALVFTAGVGEHGAEVRESICEGLQCLGLHLAASNANASPDVDVARPEAAARILVVQTREDIIMLDDVIRVLGEDNPIGGPD